MRRSIHALLLLVLACGTAQSAEAPFIRDWLVLGTFQQKDPQAMLSTACLADEGGVAPSPGERVSGRVWREASVAEAGNLDFTGMGFAVKEQCIAYAHIYVHSDREQNVLIHVGSDDGVAVLVNGREVHENLVWRGWGPDQDRVAARLGQGWNRLLFKVFNGTGHFALSARITDMEDGPLPGLRYAVANPIPGGEFPTPETDAWIVAGEVHPGRSLVDNEGLVFLPLDVSVRNLGTKDPGPLGLRIHVTDRHSGAEVMDQTFPLKVGDTGDARLLLNDPVVVGLLEPEGDVEMSITWAGGAQEVSHVPGREDYMDTLLASRLEGMPPMLPEILEYIQTNLRWARLFLGEKAELTRDFPLQLAISFVTREWTGVEGAVRWLASMIQMDAPEIRKNVIHFTGNAHIDMAWLWQYDETIQVCYETFDSALGFAERYPDFVYAQSQAQAYWWMEKRFPRLFENIGGKIEAGQWEVVGGMWVEPDLNVPSGEAIVRQLLYGKRYFADRFGVDVRVGYNPDTFGYSATLPQIFKKSGIDYFVTQKIGWNDTNTFPHRLFWWESPDGSRVLTFFPHTYVHDASIERIAREFLEFQEVTGTNRQLVLYGVGNHGGGPTQESIDRIHEMQAIEAFPTVEETTVLDFMKAVEADEKAADYPVWRDELYLEYHRGTLTSQAATKRNNRRGEILLEEAEKYAALSGMEWPSDELNESWRLVLFNQFHDILPGSSIGEVYDDAGAQYAFAHALAGRVIDRALAKTAGEIGYDSAGLPLVVFNPLSWERSGQVRMAAPGQWTAAMGLYDASGDELPYLGEGGEILFTARDVPSIGYTTFYLREPRTLKPGVPLVAKPDFLENDFLRVRLDPATGNLVSVYDKKGKREVLADGGQGNVLEIFEDVPEQWDAWNIGYTGKEWRIDEVKETFVTAATPFEAAVRVVRVFGDSTFTQDYVLRRGIPRLDIETTVDWQEDQKLVKAAFDLAAADDFATYEIPYGAIRRATVPRDSFDEAKWEVSGHKWIDLTDRSGDWGVSLLNDSKYGFDIRGSKMRITLLKAPKHPDPEADRGAHRFTYSLYPHTGDWRDGGSYRAGYELNYPLRAVVGERGDGGRDESASLVSASSPDVMITAVKKAEDSDAVVLRLVELHGRPVKATLTFHGGVSSVVEADLMEAPVGERREVGGEDFGTALTPWEIKTLLVERK